MKDDTPRGDWLLRDKRQPTTLYRGKVNGVECYTSDPLQAARFATKTSATLAAFTLNLPVEPFMP